MVRANVAVSGHNTVAMAILDDRAQLLRRTRPPDRPRARTRHEFHDIYVAARTPQSSQTSMNTPLLHDSQTAT